MDTYYSRIVVTAYVDARSTVSSRHKLPTRDEITTNPSVVRMRVVSKENMGKALDELVSEGTIKTDGLYFSVRDIEEYPL